MYQSIKSNVFPCYKYTCYYLGILALLHFRTPPPIVIDDSSSKNAAESFAVALTLTLGGYESAIAP